MTDPQDILQKRMCQSSVTPTLPLMGSAPNTICPPPCRFEGGEWGGGVQYVPLPVDLRGVSGGGGRGGGQEEHNKYVICVCFLLNM